MANTPNINIDLNVFKSVIGDASKLLEVMSLLNQQLQTLSQSANTAGNAFKSGFTGGPNVGFTGTPPPSSFAQDINNQSFYRPAPQAQGFTHPDFIVSNLNQNPETMRAYNQYTKTADAYEKAQERRVQLEKEQASEEQVKRARAIERGREVAQEQSLQRFDALSRADLSRSRGEGSIARSGEVEFLNGPEAENKAKAASLAVGASQIAPGYGKSNPVTSLKVLTPQEQAAANMQQAMGGPSTTSLPEALSVSKYFGEGGNVRKDTESLNKLSESLSKNTDAGSKLVVEAIEDLQQELTENQAQTASAVERYAEALKEAGDNPAKKAEAFQALNEQVQKGKNLQDRIAATRGAGRDVGGDDGSGGDDEDRADRRRAMMARGAQFLTAGIAATRAVADTGFNIYSGMEGRDISAERSTYGMQASIAQGNASELQKFYNIGNAEDFMRTRGDVLYGVDTPGSEYLGATGRLRAADESAMEAGRELNLARQKSNMGILNTALSAGQVAGGAVMAAGTGGAGTLLGTGAAIQGAAGVAEGINQVTAGDYSRATQGGAAGGPFSFLQNMFGTASAEDVARREKERTLTETGATMQQRTNELQDANVRARSLDVMGLQNRLNMRQQTYQSLSSTGKYTATGEEGRSEDIAFIDQVLGTPKDIKKYQKESQEARDFFTKVLNKQFGSGEVEETISGGRYQKKQRNAAFRTQEEADAAEGFVKTGATNLMSAAYQSSLAPIPKSIDEFRETAMYDEIAKGGFFEKIGKRGGFTDLGLSSIDVQRMRNQTSEVTGAGTGKASLGQVRGLAEMSMAGLGSFDQIAGNLNQLNSVVGGRDNDERLKKIFSEAVSAGFDKSGLAQKFVSSAMATASNLGVTNIESVTQQLKNTAMLMTADGKADERTLQMSQAGMAAYNQFTGRTTGTVGALKAMSIFSSGGTLAGGAGLLQDMNSAQMEDALEQLDSGKELTPEVQRLLDLNGGDKESLKKVLRNTKGASGKGFDANYSAQYGKDLKDKVAQAVAIKDPKEQKEALRVLGSQLSNIGSMMDLGSEAGYGKLNELLKDQNYFGDVDTKALKRAQKEAQALIPAEVEQKARFENAVTMLNKMRTSGSGKTDSNFLGTMIEAEKRGASAGFIYGEGEDRKSMSYSEYARIKATKEGATPEQIAGFEKAKKETDLLNVTGNLQASQTDPKDVKSVVINGLAPEARQQITQAVLAATNSAFQAAPSIKKK